MTDTFHIITTIILVIACISWLVMIIYTAIKEINYIKRHTKTVYITVTADEIKEAYKSEKGLFELYDKVYQRMVDVLSMEDEE